MDYQRTEGAMRVMTAEPPADDRALAEAVQRVRAEFLEMPGLSLTIDQAARLWAFDLGFCRRVLVALEDARFLVRTRHQAFARAD
jgi:hypothetical protein